MCLGEAVGVSTTAADTEHAFLWRAGVVIDTSEVLLHLVAPPGPLLRIEHAWQAAPGTATGAGVPSGSPPEGAHANQVGTNGAGGNGTSSHGLTELLGSKVAR